MREKQHTWWHYQARHSGQCTVSADEDKKLVDYELGVVETGRHRVFAGYFVRLTIGPSEQVTAEDERSLVGALWRLAHDASARGLRLHCVGLSGEWQESGLSENTGWGYLGRQQQPMWIMDEAPSEIVRSNARGLGSQASDEGDAPCQ